AYLRKKLVIGTIVEVTGEHRARIGVGSAEGLCVGTTLAIQEIYEWHPVRRLRVLAVTGQSCVAEEIDPSDSDPPIKVGWTVVAVRESTARLGAPNHHEED